MRNTKSTPHDDGDDGKIAAGTVAFRTLRGEAIVGDSPEVLQELQDESVDLVMTSPPFALLREKAYGNLGQEDYVDWLVGFGPHVHRVLKKTGSFVIDLGGA
jgi:DNA modification methylase